MNTTIMGRVFVCLGLVFSVLLMLPNQVDATVGGSTTINSFTYNPQDESVYFIQNDGGGRGCPPELKKISLVTGNVDVVYSCEQGEQTRKPGTYVTPDVAVEIQKFTSGFKSLTQINLPKNGFEVDINFSKDRYLSNAPDQFMGKEFTSTIYQNNKSISEHTVLGCYAEQPFTFAGYAIPGFESKIILLVSAVRDCFESGYIDEKLIVVPGVNNLKKDYYPNTMKDRLPLLPSEATLVVFESQEVIPAQESEEETPATGPGEGSPQDSEDGPEQIIGITALCLLMLVVGICIGKYTRPKQDAPLL